MDEEKWTLEEGLKIVRALQKGTRKFNYHLCIGGGVVNKGESYKDLDLFFLPLDNGTKPKAEELKSWLEDMWGKPSDLTDGYSRVVYFSPEANNFVYENGEIVSNDEPLSVYRYKLKFQRSEHERIDVFILAGQEKANGTRSESQEVSNV